MWKVSWFYEKVHNIANFGGYAAILYLRDGWTDLAQIWYGRFSPIKQLQEYW